MRKKYFPFCTGSSMLKIGRSMLLICLLFLVGSFKGEDVITGELERLAGDYEFICTFKDEQKISSDQFPDKYTLRITKKSELFVYKNGKKEQKYRFSNAEVPMDYDYDYVMFRQKNQYYPLFYKGDSVVMHIYPFEYQDNYFRKK